MRTCREKGPWHATVTKAALSCERLAVSLSRIQMKVAGEKRQRTRKKGCSVPREVSTQLCILFFHILKCECSYFMFSL